MDMMTHVQLAMFGLVLAPADCKHRCVQHGEGL